MDRCLLDLDELAISALGTQKFPHWPENIYQLLGYSFCIPLSIHGKCSPSADITKNLTLSFLQYSSCEVGKYFHSHLDDKKIG